MKIEGSVIFVGDLHGKQDDFVNYIKNNNIENTNLIILGDCGIGFSRKTLKDDFEFLNHEMGLMSNKLYIVRGNHDNPLTWDKYDHESFPFENIQLFKDGEVVEINEKQFLIFGGGLSLDRIKRIPNMSYWSGEEIKYPFTHSEEIESLYGIISHVGPLPPSILPNNEFVKSWCKLDKQLKNDLEIEKNIIAKIIENYNPSIWIYGHYHVDEIFNTNNTECHCLNELTFKQINNI